MGKPQKMVDEIYIHRTNKLGDSAVAKDTSPPTPFFGRLIHKSSRSLRYQSGERARKATLSSSPLKRGADRSTAQWDEIYSALFHLTGDLFLCGR
jgi:hypothetical protein